MGTSVSVYFPNHVLTWVDELAREEARNRSNQITKILKDVKEGRLIPSDKAPEEPNTKNSKLPPSART